MSKPVRSKILAVCLTVGTLGAVVCAEASAVTRYAAPGASGPATNCQSASSLAVRCSIATAAAGPGVTTGDVVVVEPGNYSDTAGDLGANPGSVTQVAGDIHGAPGQPRPVLTLNNVTANPAFTVTGRLSHLEIVTGVARTSNVTMSDPGGVIEDLIARSSFASSVVVVCKINEGMLRNSACLAAGNNATAVGTSTGGVTLAGQTPVLRGVTAVASGTGAHALAFYSGSTATDDGDVNAYVRNTIAHAPNTNGIEVEVSELGNGPDEADMQIDYSNYLTTENTGGGSISEQGNQETAAPSFTGDGFHQHSDSTATLNQGAPEIEAVNGDYDIDGQLRHIDGVDIGADELGRSTSMSIVCSPESIALASGPSSCNTTVTDTSPGSTGSPSGQVTLVSDSTGSFSSGGRCTLVGIGIGSLASECQLSYTPSTLGNGTHQINGTYAREYRHEGSLGQRDLGVTPALAPNPDITSPSATATGQRAAALAKCKQKRKKLDWSKKRYKKCKRAALKLPV